MIPKFFENSEIFITGGSGVVGKAIIEKLLRSCNVRKIYVLLRQKKNVAIEDRFERLKKSKMFYKLKEQKPDELDKKLMSIPGDILKPLLDITSEHRKVMANVSVIFHCAATVKFDEPLRVALKLNVGGTWEALKFAETFKHLKAFMHVSTFFSNTYLNRVEEKVYESPMNWKFCLDMLERNDVTEDQLNIITRKLIVGFPNTYCFTKNLAESLVDEYKHKLPVAIYRPSVVIFALEDPEPGFTPSLNGAVGLFAVSGAGIMKTLHIGKDSRLDLTPLDIGIKTLCYYSLKTANLYRENSKPAKIPVYISSSCTHTDITFRNYINITQDHGFWKEFAFEKNFLIPGIYCTDSDFLFFILFTLKHVLPAFLTDMALRLCGHQPLLLAAQRKVYASVSAMKPFLFNTYESAGITDIQEMTQKLRGTDFDVEILLTVKDFYSNVRFIKNMVYCLRKYLFKEDPKTIPKCRKILETKIFVYNLLKFLLAFKVYEKFLAYLEYVKSDIWNACGNSTFCSDINK